MGKFIITKSLSGEFQFNLKSTNGETILTSEGYTSRTNCHNGIESVKRSATDESMYDRKKAISGQYFFTLEAISGQTIGVSELYENESSRNNGILSVKKQAPDAIVQDNTY
jgi:uncharacterized protein YegP (UPF0339 family)